MQQKYYAAIDLKSFYASVECIQRGLDPLTTNLLVADASRMEKTICLAVSPSLKSYGIPGRARLFEAVQQVGLANALRRAKAPGGQFRGKSWDAEELNRDPSLQIDYITAPPRMSLYMQTSTKIYEIYLQYVAPEDMHVYSVDEVFLDITPYLKTSGLTPYAFVRQIIRDVVQQTGITATAGIGTNLYLSKIAMDIVAKHEPADAYGVRIAQMDEMGYRRLLWDHRPLTDFWRVGPGYARKLEKVGLHTMGDVARCSLGGPDDFHNEELLFRLFGVAAELLIDHAWGVEPCTIADIKAYRPESNSISSGQVLTCPYPADKARLVMREMTDLLVLDLVDKGLMTDQMVLTVGYDVDNLLDPERRQRYKGPVETDRYGRKVPKYAHGTANLPAYSSSTREITQAVMALFDRIVDKELLVRRMTIAACRILTERAVSQASPMEQLDLFAQPEAAEAQEACRQREKRRQQTVLEIQKKYGKNAILKGMNLEEGATARERNRQIGGHKA